MRNFKFLALLALSFPALAATSPRAYYSVPVPPEYAAEASFPMPEGIQLTKDGDKAHLIYKLPAELVGPNHPSIDLVQTAATPDWVDLAGHFGTARCNKLEAGAGLCLIDYDNMEIKPQEVEAFLRTKYAGAPDLDKRLWVARVFGNEPAGILRYGEPSDLPPHP